MNRLKRELRKKINSGKFHEPIMMEADVYVERITKSEFEEIKKRAEQLNSEIPSPDIGDDIESEE